ncbi:trifunctional transcriptional activator/DNA repair protein Ada/methylated-DNA--[protein]-cysteine S-methyltransferase [Rhizobium sp. LC145]|jgi:AraC family transcriptional regulator, regulatory protein of adaptative response / methylated-DNA-[protein]-cysteine methyltransferase|uniref:bifunctional transcriptional activator/DNA repair enzyme AdaA n=1 Tax=Rhizobium sp. LC145 TaxID=1120688 RepID=UPI000629F489|nr:trifunctional transcriptional activator/DNA repair protein Ada/methylated-DNA--[protein]-cysteine S-methyltransferase [Rhizobium sp. LC145]KKX34453.1 6-O-methylguanine DNA methyltransferase [Rhizobium sp. LC145]TKT43428.1 bifunctional transcriptional activator/DNA repair protein Ada [Rhizobiaceae bacterium LC148]
MLFERPNDDLLYEALIARDPAYEGFAYAAVRTTGIFCRLTCPARKPKRENTAFYGTIAECLEAGFRPCIRCKPMLKLGGVDPVVSKLLQALDAEPERRWSEDDIGALGIDPSTARRAFKRQFGMSFLEIARLRRMGKAAEMLASGESVIDTQLDAGYSSGSGFRSAITKLFGAAPANLRDKTLLRADWIETPIGPMMAIADSHALHLLEFAERKALPAEIRKLQRYTGSGIAMGRHPPIDQIEAELTAYFNGEDRGFQTRLAGHGSPFQRRVWEALRAIPTGGMRTYGALAMELDAPSSTRAVAGANGANQIAIVIPCHRVLGADGSLTGYGGGLWRKRWLLEHERRMAARAERSEPEKLAASG